jgi:hypothetical protein
MLLALSGRRYSEELSCVCPRSGVEDLPRFAAIFLVQAKTFRDSFAPWTRLYHHNLVLPTLPTKCSAQVSLAFVYDH